MTDPHHPKSNHVQSPEEPSWVRASADGDQLAYGYLYTLHYPRLQVAINFITQNGDETDEILQETFLRIWKTKEKLLLVRSFEDYAFRVARNLLFDQLRRKKVHLKAIDALTRNSQAETNGGDAQLEYKEYHDIATRAIDQLEPQKKEIFLLRTQEGLSFEEIADKCGIAVVTAKKHFYAAFHALKTLLNEHGGVFTFLLILWSGRK